jgi:hypothetical protein
VQYELCLVYCTSHRGRAWVTVAAAVADSSMKPAMAAPKVLPLASFRFRGSLWRARREVTSKILASFLNTPSWVFPNDLDTAQ